MARLPADRAAAAARSRREDLARRLEAQWWSDGPLARALVPLSWLYGLVWRIRAALYRHGWREQVRLPVPVVVVGNVIVGGAGKTPTVAATVRVLRRHGLQPGVVSRGYGRSGDAAIAVDLDSDAAAVGDEPLMLKKRLGIPVFVGRRRVLAARRLLESHPDVDVIVSDDGAQHLALGRDALVLVFDERGAGNARLLPSGPLREPLGRQPPAGSIVLYNASSPTTHWPGIVVQRALAGVVELQAWLHGAPARPDALQALAGRRIVAVAGIANPEKFFAMLEGAGLEIERMPLPDHHPYDSLPWDASQPDVVVTEKDAVKLRPQALGRTRVWVATLDFDPGPRFEQWLLQRVRDARRDSPKWTHA